VEALLLAAVELAVVELAVVELAVVVRQVQSARAPQPTGAGG
jgi:hypothetical protein